MNDLQTGIELLARFRQNAAEAKEILDTMLAELKANAAYQFWQERLSEANQAGAALQNQLAEEAVQAYLDSGSKHPHPAVTVKMSTTVRYDPRQAIDWCTQNLPGALALDPRFFETHVKAVSKTAPVPIAEIVTRPKATFSTDLSAYLPAQPEVQPVEVVFDETAPIPF